MLENYLRESVNSKFLLYHNIPSEKKSYTIMECTVPFYALKRFLNQPSKLIRQVIKVCGRL